MIRLDRAGIFGTIHGICFSSGGSDSYSDRSPIVDRFHKVSGSATDGSIATNQPANSDIYLDKYQRMTLTYDPPGKTFVPAFQVADFGKVMPLTVYLDNIEIFLLPRDQNRRF